MNPTTSTRSYYPSIDGLRGIAILLVICCSNFDFVPYFEFGWIGVDLFFVLCGFLITDILLRTGESKNFLRNFYIRRLLKILPLYYGVLLFYFLFASFLQNLAVQYQYYHAHQRFMWLHLQNWLCIIHIRPAGSMMLNHLWSLSILEQFYLIWPIIILIIRNTRLLARIAILIIIACVLTRLYSWSIYGDGLTNFYLQYMTRIDGLCIGSLVAIWRFQSYEESKKKVFRLGLIVFGAQLILLVLSKIAGPFPHFTFVGYTCIATGFGIAVFYAIGNRNTLSRLLLENTVIKFIGKISYGLYVFHWPILTLFKIYLLKQLIGRGYTASLAYITISSIALLVTLVISILSYYFFEKKILALKDLITQEGFFTRAWKKLLVFFNRFSIR